jgi:alkanesulfonate monooxygenase SsuD/methylene tetrahydromethanopterin reductase-like flavin-dependent oxidoreductase (luciferase family)
VKIGYKLFAEAFSPQDLVTQAVRAEQAGFDRAALRRRFTLGVGAGERLNEHVVGRGWPAVGVRHELLREALEIIRLLATPSSPPSPRPSWSTPTARPAATAPATARCRWPGRPTRMRPPSRPTP